VARIPVWLLLAASFSPAWKDAESRFALLTRVQAKMRRIVPRFPDYTCAEVITRSVSRGTASRVDYMDRVRLEVAVVRGQELFAWPGAARGGIAIVPARPPADRYRRWPPRCKRTTPSVRPG
jgi:hypothetical protein